MTRYCVGIDNGFSSVKVAVVSCHGEEAEIRLCSHYLGKMIRGSFERTGRLCLERALEEAAIKETDVDYVASTGLNGVEFSTGHFYSMTAHARGALFAWPEARAVIDVGALRGRVLRMDERGRVVNYRMTSQCASGFGQFLDNVARSLNLTVEEAGRLSLEEQHWNSKSSAELGSAEASLKICAAEAVSNVCPVLAETDVINLVSRGLPAGAVLRAIFTSMAETVAKELHAMYPSGNVFLSGGLATNPGFGHAIREVVKTKGLAVRLEASSLSPFVGAIGAAIWGMHRQLRRVSREATQGRCESV